MTLYKRWFIYILFLSISFIPAKTSGWHNSINGDNYVERQPEEVFLTFSYQNLFNRVIIAQYEEGQFYLPVSEIFTALQIPHQISQSPPSISGSYLRAENTFELNFKSYQVTLKDEGRFSFSASEMLIGETDFYVTPEILEKVFDLDFSVDFNNLVLRLETDVELPVVAEHKRARDRRQQERYVIGQDYYPLVYDRDRKTFAGGFLDYSLSANVNPGINYYTHNFGLGTEVLGGDLQGNAFGNYSENSSNFTTNNVRWRYAWRNNNNITQLFVGQTVSRGLSRRAFVGIRATNEPVEPRFVYDDYEIEGNAAPGSEVELYFNNALYDYQQINENGRYRFIAPLTYGSSRLQLKIYDPAGGVREETRRIQVPFNFLRTGELNYDLSAGRLENPIFGSTQRSNLAHGNVGYGVSNWLTQRVGVEYLDQFSGQTPQFYSSTSARFFKEYLLNVDVAPEAFYRISGGAIYPSSASWNVDYTYFENEGLYNALRSKQELNGNLYLPFSLNGRMFNIRLQGNHSIRSTSSLSRYSVDLNTRFDRLNIRMRYSDTQTNEFSLQPSLASQLSTSATYFIDRNAQVPPAFRETYIRGHLSYNPNLAKFIQAETEISKYIARNGRIRASFSRNFRGDFNFFSLGIILDFPGVRTTSTLNSSRSGASFTQNVLGSVGFDHNTDDITFSNRQQVGRSSMSVRFFVDENNSGTYEPGEEIVKNNALRIDRSGITRMNSKGTIHVSQLQPYNQINVEINKSNIRNPLLVPEIENFSIVTDPNQYKPLNIPLYMSGIISGKVDRLKNGEKTPLPGLRVYISSADQSYLEEMRTFNDGSFYAYEVPPGDYQLYIDGKQLNFLNAVSRPDTMQVEIKATADGDFVEGLNFVVVPASDTSRTDKKIIASEDQESDSLKTDSDQQGQEIYYQIQLASFKTTSKANEVAKKARDDLAEPFEAVQNVSNGLYAIRSAPIMNKENADQRIFSYQSKQYPRAALVILQGEGRISGFENDQFIRIGSFNDINEARSYSINVAQNLSKEIAISYSPDGKNHIVFINESYSSDENLDSQINSLKEFSFLHELSPVRHEDIMNNTLERRRTMKFRYQLQIDGITSENEQELLRSLISDRSDITINETGDGTYVFENFTSWADVKELQEELEKIDTAGLPIPILIEQ